jgi:hypothetical protein
MVGNPAWNLGIPHTIEGISTDTITLWIVVMVSGIRQGWKKIHASIGYHDRNQIGL